MTMDEVIEGLIYIDETLDLLAQDSGENADEETHSSLVLLYKIKFQMARNVLKNILSEKNNIKNQE
jgi:hypothetical protein